MRRECFNVAMGKVQRGLFIQSSRAVASLAQFIRHLWINYQNRRVNVHAFVCNNFIAAHMQITLLHRLLVNFDRVWWRNSSLQILIKYTSLIVCKRKDKITTLYYLFYMREPHCGEYVSNDIEAVLKFVRYTMEKQPDRHLHRKCVKSFWSTSRDTFSDRATMFLECLSRVVRSTQSRFGNAIRMWPTYQRIVLWFAYFFDSSPQKPWNLIRKMNTKSALVGSSRWLSLGN